MQECEAQVLEQRCARLEAERDGLRDRVECMEDEARRAAAAEAIAKDRRLQPGTP